MFINRKFIEEIEYIVIKHYLYGCAVKVLEE